MYGFASTKERALFKELISVNGVGPNTARMMLSSLNPDELVRAVVNEDIASIKAIKGIGLKTAQRIVVDLKDGLSKFEIAETVIPNNNKNREEALLALQTLGFNKLLIEKTVDKILKEGVDYSVEELIRLALKVL
ncbi:MAG: Holliday junction branch migration protein RuvA [Bacteroidales bacterium]|nr:Holliday junction branch migration protein RuvA [Bacteroidales bacterium]